MAEDNELKPLDIRCTKADCDNDLHCFKQSRKMKAANQIGQCRYCGIELVDWQRVHRKSLGDVHYTFDALKHEFIRHYYWHVPIDERAVNYARRKGRRKLLEAAERIISQKVGSATPYHDGYQTPKSGNPVYYAQHATGCCCRTCMQYWHGIEKGRELRNSEIEYFRGLVMLYIEERIPTLTEDGEKIPPLRHLRNSSVSNK